jgi:hypothetical protein
MCRCILIAMAFFGRGRLRQRPEGTYSGFQHDLYQPGAANHDLCDRAAAATNHLCDAGLRFAPHHHDSDPQPKGARPDTVPSGAV